MCGIVGYVGPKACVDLLVDGLRRLEYRGYDSAGLAIHDGKEIKLLRSVGKLGNLVTALKDKPLQGAPGIGHTRWATHGRPSETNAHPHVSGGTALVHNGIIENHLHLKRQLVEQGVKFSSDTDTEIVAHLVEREVKAGHKLLDAVRRALSVVEGAYAVAVLHKDEPDRIVIAKNASPLVIGIGDGETYCASDIPAILPYTRNMLLLEEGEIALLTAGGVEITTLAGAKVDRKPKTITWNASQAEKSGYKHFMLKEIHEQPRAIEDTLRGRIDLDKADVVGAEIGLTDEIAKSIGRVYFVACGTSAHAAMAGRYWVEQLARVPSTVEIGSEVRYRDPVFLPTDLVVAVSQSGETADTLAAVKAAKAQGARVLAVANVLDSAIPRAADGSLYTHAGPEIGVASTKCFTTQLAALLLLAVYLGRRRGTLPETQARRILDAAWAAPAKMRDVLARADDIRVIARRHMRAKDMLFLGRGTGFPIALEGALKLKEISYIHAEGYAAGEMKHGPIALIDEEMPVVVICPKDAHYEKTFSNMQEAKAREGQIIAIATEDDEEVRRICADRADRGSIPPPSARGAMMAADMIEIPQVEDEIVPLMSVVPLQLLAYHMADLKGTDVDQPRNLAKTVTVE